MSFPLPKRFAVQRSLLYVVFVLLFVSKAEAGDESASLPDNVLFNEHIRPILTARCTGCHGGVQQAGDVSFVYLESVLPPEGWIVEPGNPDASVLIERITSTDADTVMPPPEHGKPLSKHEVELFRKWILDGAKWTNHWSFETPQAKALPSIKNAQWPRQRIDHFVLAELERRGLAPAEDESPHRWLRRATLDLTGLPPTPQETEAFLHDLKNARELKDANGDSELAYQRVVDRLLESPSYGERWASVWLDQLRYADSKGLGLDGRRNVWKYRDWVINAFNQDMPFDQFTIKQIAGDLLPGATIDDRIATAANRLTQSNEEGGTDDEEFRIAAILDRVSTTFQTWQGLTIGCVQCHSHPYDPITHEEYYNLVAFFNNTADCDLDEDWPVVKAPVDPEDSEGASQLDNEIAKLRSEVWTKEFDTLRDASLWKPLTGLTASTNNATGVKVERKGDHDEFYTHGTVSRSTDFTLETPLPSDIKKLTAIRVTAMPLDPVAAVADSEWGFVWSEVEASLVLSDQPEAQPLKIERLIIDEPEPFHNPQESLNGKSPLGFSAFTRMHYPREAALVLDKPIDVPEGARLRVELKHRVMILASFSLITRRGQLAVSDSEAFHSLVADESMKKLRGRLAALQDKRRQIPSTDVPVMRELPSHLARPTHLFIRGLFLTKDKQVNANVPAIFAPLKPDTPVDRLALANWLVSRDNPLTSRVTVNRWWARIFGVGLVATEEDFGSSGEPPSHPELLDDLAWRFQNEMGLSTKKLLRELVLSRTYRQSTRNREGIGADDPYNRLLARGPRRRLTAEEVRDQALAVSGFLSDKQFGPPVHPPIPEGVWRPFVAADKWNTPKANEPDRYRRSIYTYTKRSIPYPMFAAFDAPSREFCTPRRMPSNTPLQALMTLNDQTFVECAEGLAGRMKTAGSQLNQQLAYGFYLTTSRQPRESELDELLKLYQSSSANSSVHTQDLAMKQVASLLLNLDESLTK